MASNYSEYSRLRSIARKRSERLGAAGLAQTVRFPTVKELKAKGVSPAAAMRSVSSFLSSPTTVKEYKKIEPQKRPVILPTSMGAVVTTKQMERIERRREQNRESSRRYRERIRNLTKQEKSYIKAAKTLGLHITPSNAKAFSEYMDFRFAQGSDSVHYRIARYVEDYMSIIAKNGYSPSEILNDFNLFLSDRSELMAHADGMNGISPEYIDELFDEFIND